MHVRTIARPGPVPLSPWVVKNGSKARRSTSGGMPRPVVGDLDPCQVLLLARSDGQPRHPQNDDVKRVEPGG